MALTITETEPVPIVRDFHTFITYLTRHDLTLSKANQFIPRNALFELNTLMTDPNVENTPRTTQEYYPLLHLFYHLAVSGKLFQKVAANSQKLKLQRTERLDQYAALTPTEKYFFLLETLWVDCNWNKLGDNALSRFSVFNVERILERLAQSAPGQSIPARQLVAETFLVDGEALRPLTFFGFFSMTRDDPAYQRLMFKRYFPVAALIPSVWGVTLGPVLARQRPLEHWNLPRRRALGDNVWLPGLADDAQRAELYVPFFVPFTQFFEPGALQRTLPRTGKTYREGIFIFKVSLGRDCWRTIAVPSDCTLDDLHLAIQHAYDFDNDHLYAFFMDGKRWSSEAALYSPECDEGPYASADRIGELDLVPNLPFLYLFDFGDEWQFEVRLLEIRREAKGLTQPTLMESHGKAPPQYPHWDE